MGFLNSHSTISLTPCIRLWSWWRTGREEDNSNQFCLTWHLPPSLPFSLASARMPGYTVAQPCTPCSQGLWQPPRQVTRIWRGSTSCSYQKGWEDRSEGKLLSLAWPQVVGQSTSGWLWFSSTGTGSRDPGWREVPCLARAHCTSLYLLSHKNCSTTFSDSGKAHWRTLYCVGGMRRRSRPGLSKYHSLG